MSAGLVHHFTDQPPVLFEVKCDQHSVEVGGFPWHYLCSPQGKQGTFHVRSLTNNVLAEHGNLRMDTLNYEPDRACFFGDESGRILHIGPTELSFSNVHQYIVILILQETSQPLYTSSGRRIQRSVSQDELMDCPNFTIYNVDYEDELDVLWTSAVYHNDNGPAGIVGFHDNLTGKLLKEIEIEEPFDEMYEHRIIVDLDTIIQVVKSGQGKFVCIFYRLQGNVKEDSEKSDTKCDSSEGSRRGQRSRRRSSRSRSRSQSVDRMEIRGRGRRIMNVDIE
ncbi:hypothetical protein FSP39_011934 [Pinctada imbricata]|uniref:Uncharacterized protein n=1 Tax=Pinctada imbricata TaxID=66713 RepID=A0AA88YG55_PINIB|nr:hypothetical protein FSP39_011934 [Pinctada imbricata]